MYPFLPIGVISVIAMFAGLLARDTLGVDLANILLFGGVIVGCVNGFIEVVIEEYRNVKDWSDDNGDPKHLPPKDKTNDSYRDISQTDKLVEVVKTGSSANVEISEKILEEFLEKNLTTLEKGLSLVGRQYPTATGPIDLLCKDKNNDFVVIELKKGRTSDKVVGQILRYIAFIEETKLQRDDQKVRGIIVGREIDKSLEMSLKAIKERDITLKTFDANIRIDSL